MPKFLSDLKHRLENSGQHNGGQYEPDDDLGGTILVAIVGLLFAVTVIGGGMYLLSLAYPS